MAASLVLLREWVADQLHTAAQRLSAGASQLAPPLLPVECPLCQQCAEPMMPRPGGGRIYHPLHLEHLRHLKRGAEPPAPRVPRDVACPLCDGKGTVWSRTPKGELVPPSLDRILALAQELLIHPRQGRPMYPQGTQR